jgi:uncharacterized protein YdhG (YjbR/CyaY superfamily)
MGPFTPSLDSVDAYIQSFPENIQHLLQEIRNTVKSVVPEAQESISYKMPAYTYKSRPLVYFAAFRNHIGFYPIPSGIDAFQAELSLYQCSKGAVQFPLNQPMPLELIARITAFRAEENRQKAIAKKNIR